MPFLLKATVNGSEKYLRHVANEQVSAQQLEWTNSTEEAHIFANEENINTVIGILNTNDPKISNASSEELP